ncbi:MAG: heparan-alpha-glucosaminide N-acetyltransferase domain-containing protein [Promethearchaeia archaeon]
MKRLKSVDIFRGICIIYMVIGHMSAWWVIETDYWLYKLFWNLGAAVGGGGFLLVSGISAALSYRLKMTKYKQAHSFRKESIRNEYIIRALLILVISFAWNIGAILLGLVDSGIKGIWLWFVIQAISISLILAWPLLKTSRMLRVIVAFSSWIANEFIFAWLIPYRNQANGFGILFYILYNEPKQNVILGYFPFLLMGTVIGDMLYDIFTDNPDKQRSQLKKKVYLPYGIGGASLIIFGIIFLFPAFLSKITFSSHMFIFGIELVLIAFLVWLKDDKSYQPKRNYRVLIFYSFYSFSIFLGHHMLFFIFPRSFNAIDIWFFIVPTVILWTFLWRFIYKKVGRDASLKVQVSKIATYLSEKFETRKRLESITAEEEELIPVKEERKEKS